jgi:hypothetical protein
MMLEPNAFGPAPVAMDGFDQKVEALPASES